MTFELQQEFRRCIKPIYKSLRTQKLKLLFQLLGGGEQGSLLDVGGGQGSLGDPFLLLYRMFKKVVIVNLVGPKVNCEGHDGIGGLIADGCTLPFKDHAFDWVFSNAVIEHVGDWKKQKQFADEIRRVASKGYFVATPNKWFPIDPHTLLPFYQFIPPRFQRKVVGYSPGFMRAYEEINLLSRGQLQSMFPESVVAETGLPMFPHSIIACWRAERSLRQWVPSARSECETEHRVLPRGYRVRHLNEDGSFWASAVFHSTPPPLLGAFFDTLAPFPT